VRFLDGPKLLAAIPLESGVATLTTTDLAAGIRNVTAQYSGDAGLAKSRSALSVVVNGGSLTTLAASNSKVETEQTVTFTATVGALTGTGIPTGTVTFYDGAAAAERPLVGGKAVFSSNALSIGSHSIVAVYNGSADYVPSTSRGVATTIVKAKTITVLS